MNATERAHRYVSNLQEKLADANQRIKRLEEESESRWNLAESAIASCDEMASRIKRMEEAGDGLLELCEAEVNQHHLADQIDARCAAWRKAKEAKP